MLNKEVIEEFKAIYDRDAAEEVDNWAQDMLLDVLENDILSDLIEHIDDADPDIVVGMLVMYKLIKLSADKKDDT